MNAFQGKVTSAELNHPLSDVSIKRFHPDGSPAETLTTNENGQYQLSTVEQDETLKFEKKGYVQKGFKANTLPNTVRLLETRTIGYQGKLWFQPGETVRVFVQSPSPYSATLYRHGLNKQIVLEPGEQSPILQSVPDGFFVESGLDWKTAFTYQIPINAKPCL